MLLKELAARYAAREVTLKPIRDGQGGASIYEASLDGVKRALRISGPFLSARPEWVEFEGRLLTLAPMVAKAIPGADGRFGQPVEGELALLTEWADGDVEWPAPPNKAEILGRTVANLHLATAEMDTQGDLRSFGTDGLIDRPMALISEIADTGPLQPFINATRERIESIPRNAQTFGAIHGDVHQGNCHFHGETATLFDFAQCGVGWRAFDLAGFLWPWRDDSILKPELRAGCDAYLAGYQAVRPLTAGEQSALPAFIRARDLWEAGEWIATGDARQKPKQVQDTVRILAARWGATPMAEAL